MLVVDDICTEGNSFEAARAYLRAAGAQAVCVSWLKTINTDYRAVSPALGYFNPYIAQTFPASIATVNQWYSSAISSHAAPTDLADVYNRYFSWARSEEHTSELQSLMRISYAVFCLKKKTHNTLTS